jgi:hypothetical protein
MSVSVYVVYRMEFSFTAFGSSPIQGDKIYISGIYSDLEAALVFCNKLNFENTHKKMKFFVAQEASTELDDLKKHKFNNRRYLPGLPLSSVDIGFDKFKELSGTDLTAP